jgi:predicted Rdx family selenoprotein
MRPRAEPSQRFEATVGAVEVVPGADGIFDVQVEGGIVFTKSMLGRYPDPNDILPLLRSRISA